jgi:hypothetical protein
MKYIVLTLILTHTAIGFSVCSTTFSACTERSRSIGEGLGMRTFSCPMQFGNAVSQARSVLFNVTNVLYSNVCEAIAPPNGHRLANQATNANPIATIKLYPNPSNGLVTFTSNTELSYNISVFNILGEAVANVTLKNEQIINLSSLPPATYVVLINYNGSLVKTERITIIH